VSKAHPIAAFVLDAAFAPSLLLPLGKRSFAVHLWGASGGGKTAVLKFATSAWGDPGGLMATLNSTVVGSEFLARSHNDLPTATQVYSSRGVSSNPGGPLSVADAARLAQRDPETIRRAIRNGNLAASRPGRGRYLIDFSTLTLWLNKQQWSDVSPERVAEGILAQIKFK